MTAKETRDLTTAELQARLKDENDHLLRLRLNHAVSSIENPSDIRDSRRMVARLKTILRERALSESKDN